MEAEEVEREERESFFKWKKIFVRSAHLTLVLFITTSLLVNNTSNFYFDKI
jgi:hypothetical protein